MNGRVVFLHYHGTGHINPCLPLAQILRHNLYDVHFAGVEFFHRYVTAQGFPHYVLKSVPFGLGFETWANTIDRKKNIYLATLRDRVTDKLYALRETSLVKMIQDLDPDVIFLDATQPTDFIVLYPHLKGTRIKVAMIHAMFPTHVLPGRPPVNSDALPENDGDVRKAIRNMKRQQFKKAWRQKLRFLGFDDRYIINRRLKANKIPAQYHAAISSLFNFNVKGIPEFILAPREYDFPDFAVTSDQHYIGFMPTPSPRGTADDDFTATWDEIKEKRRLKNRKLIYCAFGTIETEERQVIQSILEKITTVARRNNYLLIISVATQSADIVSLASDTTYVFKSVPQILVLEHADLFITHGGLSSVKESIYAEVPMLMYAVHADFDPKGNAARVAYHGMGLRGNAKADTEHEIQEKINALLTNRDFRKNIVNMKTFNTKYTAEKFMALFETINPLRS